MRWLIQEMLNKPENVFRIMDALEQTNTSYLYVRLNQDDTCTVLDKEWKVPLDDSNTILKEFIKNQQVTVYGSKKFADIADKMGLSPGSFINEQFDFAVCKEQLGTELLNYDLVIGELSELSPIAETFFIRPTGNTKLFTGTTVTKEAFLEWQERENKRDSHYIGETLLIAPVQDILFEYRFFVVNGVIITNSSYRVKDKFDTSLKASEQMIAYTNAMIQKFPLAVAFVIDIAETKNGFKVIEYNNINCSGLYNCDEVAIVQAINTL